MTTPTTPIQPGIRWKTAVRLADRADLNDYDLPGLYYVSSPLNAPVDDVSWYLFVNSPPTQIRPEGVVQEITNSTTGTTYKRIYTNGAWTDWTAGSGDASAILDAHIAAADPHPQYLNNARGDARYYQKSEIDTALSGKADVDHGHAISDISDLQTELDAKADLVHAHAISDVTGLQTALDGKAALDHDHLIADVTGLQTALDGKADLDHAHIIDDVTGLQAALDAKADDVHSHVIDDVTGLQSALDAKQDDLGFTPENTANKGAAGGYASLDGSGLVPASQLPSYVDDVVEVADFASLPGTGETSKIYVTLDDNTLYRWGGSAYVAITASPGSTDAVPEGSTNLYYTNARADARAALAVAAHEAATDPHTQYHTDARGDARYYQKSEVDTALAGKSDTGHGHVISDVTGLQTALDGKQPYDADLDTWASLTPSANAQSLVTAANYAAMRALLDLEAGTDFYSISAADTAFQPKDAELTAISGLVSASDRLPYFTGVGTAALATFSAFGRSLVDDADASAARTTLGVVIGTDVQAHASNLDTWATVAPSANGQSLVSAVNYAAMRALLDLEAGTDFYSISAADAAFQPKDTELTALAGLTSAADQMPYFTGAGTAGLTTITSFGRSLVDDTDAATARATLGLVIGTDVQPHDADLDAWATKTAPTGTVVGTSDTQTLTGKAIDADNNTISNIGAAEVKPDLISGQTAASGTTGDYLIMWDATDSMLKKVAWTDLPGASSGGLSNVVEDTTPQLGGNLDTNGNDIIVKTGDAIKTGTTLSDTFDLQAYNTSTASYVTFATLTAGNPPAMDLSPFVTSSGEFLLTEGAIGSTVQAYDADLTTWASLTPSANAQSLVTAANYAAMRALLDLEAGTDFYSISAADAAFQPKDTELTALAALTSAADKLPYFTGAGTAATTTLTTFGRSLVDDTDAATARTTLGLVIGTDVQAYDADLTAWAAVNPSSYYTSSQVDALIAALPTDTVEEIQDIVGAMVSGNTETLITVTYQDVDGTLDFVVDNNLANYDNTTSGFTTAAAVAASYQPKDTELTALAGLTSAADTLPYFTGAGTAGTTTLSAFGRTLIDDASASAARSTLGLVIGSNVQAYDAELAALAALTSAADALPYFTGVGVAATTTLTSTARGLLDDTSTSAMRTTLGLVIGTDVQAYDADLASWAGVTRASGFDTFAATPTSANFKSLITDETGAGALVFAQNPTLTNSASGTQAFTAENTADAASVLVGVLQGDRATPAANDYAFVDMRLSDSAGNQETFARMKWQALDTTNTSEDGALIFSVITAGTIADELGLTGDAIYPTTAGGLTIGSASNPFGDVYLGANKTIYSNGNDQFIFSGTTIEVTRNMFRTDQNPGLGGTAGWSLLGSGVGQVSASGTTPFYVNRLSSDGNLVDFRRGGTTQGNITVTSGTVSLTAFCGTHWGRFEGDAKPDVLLGTVIDCAPGILRWRYVQFEDADGVGVRIPYNGTEPSDVLFDYEYEGTVYEAIIIDEEPDLELVKHVNVKISDTPASSAVYGVFASYDDEHGWNDVLVASVGNFFVRINAGEKVAIGDLIESAGNGCARKQDDDIVRSKTIGKITDAAPQQIFEDGSYIVPCVLYCG